MRIYEELFIVKPDAPEEEIDQFIEQMKSVVSGAGGSVDKVDKWGKRRLAYRVDKYREGAYVLFQFNAAPETVKEFERRLRVSDLVIKFLTVRIDQTLKRLEKRKKRPRKAGPSQSHGGSGHPAQPSVVAADAGRTGGSGVARRIDMAESKGRPGSAGQRPTGGDKAVATQKKQYFRRKKGVPLLRRENRRYQLQGRPAAIELYRRARQDRAAPHLGRVRARTSAVWAMPSRRRATLRCCRSRRRFRNHGDHSWKSF